MPCLITRAGFGETNAFEQVTQGLIWTAVLEGGAEPPSMFVEPEPGISPPPKENLGVVLAQFRSLGDICSIIYT